MHEHEGMACHDLALLPSSAHEQLYMQDIARMASMQETLAWLLLMSYIPPDADIHFDMQITFGVAVKEARIARNGMPSFL